ncbi:MAG TPA: YgiT-type zinc finger protein [Candidatus Hydrogenedentes bacterium]|nr:YgiT-type zinc finger protein [Candidatus Hydrogenedentota bacterium]
MNTCYYCKGDIERARIEHMARARDGYVFVRNLSVERCTQCGEVYLDAAASRQIDAALDDADSAQERLQVPVV